MNRNPRLVYSPDNKQLTSYANRVRTDVLHMIQHAGSGNPGSALSCVEILVWLLHHEMRIRVPQPRWPKRDRLILSKGHAAPVFYSICTQLGWVKHKELMGYRQINTRLQTHPEYHKLICIDYTSGSLGQGLSAAVGMALAARYLKNLESRFFVLLGDGEIQEGQIWEAAMTAGHYELNNVVAILDRNVFQGDGATEKILSLEPLMEKWRAFRWEVQEADGHSFENLADVLSRFGSSKPKLLIAHTVKGKGVSFMEKNNEWHVGGKKFTGAVLKRALSEIGV